MTTAKGNCSEGCSEGAEYMEGVLVSKIEAVVARMMRSNENYMTIQKRVAGICGCPVTMYVYEELLTSVDRKPVNVQKKPGVVVLEVNRSAF